MTPVKLNYQPHNDIYRKSPYRLSVVIRELDDPIFNTKKWGLKNSALRKISNIVKNKNGFNLIE